MLRGRSASSGVARKSQHILGKAIDVRLEGIETATNLDVAGRDLVDTLMTRHLSEHGMESYSGFQIFTTE